MSPLLRSLALYARCRRMMTDFTVEIYPLEGVDKFGQKLVTEYEGLLHWRIGLLDASSVRARGVSLLGTTRSLWRSLEDLGDFLGLQQKQAP